MIVEDSGAEPPAERRLDPQVTAYVTPEERDQFEAYAGQFGLDAGNLLHLVWQHELRVGRLQELASAFQDASGAIGPGALTSKVTAHLSDISLKQHIKDHAAQAELSVSRAGAVLLREEMRARWLARSLDFGDSN